MIVNDIQEMKKQGMSDVDIIQKLREQGISPMEIHQALEQSTIKAAVAQDDSDVLTGGQMQPSMMQEGQNQEQQQPQEQEQDQQEYPMPEQQYPAEQQQYSQYPQYQQYQPSENVSEIAEQVADEKINAFRKKMGNLDELKIILGKKVEDMDDRLKRIEEVIDLLQKAIINKIGTYGDSIEQIRDEMSMMQESFSKAIPGMRRKEVQKEERKEERSERKKSDGFEHYLRR